MGLNHVASVHKALEQSGIALTASDLRFGLLKEANMEDVSYNDPINFDNQSNQEKDSYVEDNEDVDSNSEECAEETNSNLTVVQSLAPGADRLTLDIVDIFANRYDDSNDNELLVKNSDSKDGRKRIFDVLGKSLSVKNFEPEEKIGEGTFGVVHRARYVGPTILIKQPKKKFRFFRGKLDGKEYNANHETFLVNNKIYALKRICTENETLDSGLSVSILREITILKSLRHPNIVQLLDVAVGENRLDQLYMVMEFCGRDLGWVMDNVLTWCNEIDSMDSSNTPIKPTPSEFTDINGKTLPVRVRKINRYFSEIEIQTIMLQLLRGCLYLHQQGIIHRDLKLTNLLIDRDGILRITDFGLSTGFRYLYGGDQNKPEIIISRYNKIAELNKDRENKLYLQSPGIYSPVLSDSTSSPLLRNLTYNSSSNDQDMMANSMSRSVTSDVKSRRSVAAALFEDNGDPDETSNDDTPSNDFESSTGSSCMGDDNQTTEDDSNDSDSENKMDYDNSIDEDSRKRKGSSNNPVILIPPPEKKHLFIRYNKPGTAEFFDAEDNERTKKRRRRQNSVAVNLNLDGDASPPMTTGIVTLWYRSPELIVGSDKYDFSVDIWSIGCIFAELLIGRPLFPGKNEQDELRLISELIGLLNHKRDQSLIARYSRFKNFSKFYQNILSTSSRRPSVVLNDISEFEEKNKSHGKVTDHSQKFSREYIEEDALRDTSSFNNDAENFLDIYTEQDANIRSILTKVEYDLIPPKANRLLLAKIASDIIERYSETQTSIPGNLVGIPDINIPSLIDEFAKAEFNSEKLPKNLINKKIKDKANLDDTLFDLLGCQGPRPSVLSLLLLEKFLRWDPKRRISCNHAIEDPWIKSVEPYTKLIYRQIGRVCAEAIVYKPE